MLEGDGPQSEPDSPRNIVADQFSELSMGNIEYPGKRKKVKTVHVYETGMKDEISESSQDEEGEVLNKDDNDDDNRELVDGLDEMETKDLMMSNPPTPTPEPKSKSKLSKQSQSTLERIPDPSHAQSASPLKKIRPTTTKKKQSPSPPPSLTWQDSEITGHLIDPSNDPDDDGTGLNGIGFRPTPAIAYARSQRRRQQVMEWKAREAREARQKRLEGRRGMGIAKAQSEGTGVEGSSNGGQVEATRRVVRFVGS